MNKLRSSLTALGIIIGVLSVTVMGTLISGLDRSFEDSMSWLGKDILYISRWEWFSDMEWWEVRNRPRMRTEYVDKIKEKSKYALAVSPVMQRGASLSYEDKETRTEIEAAVFRRLLNHLDQRKDVQNIDLMNLAGVCRYCLSKWYVNECENQGEDVSYDKARDWCTGCLILSGRQNIKLQSRSCKNCKLSLQ